MSDKVPDIQLFQDIKILQQIVAQVIKKGGTPMINVVTIGPIGEVNIGDDRDFGLEQYFDKLPKPRLKHLTEEVMKLALAKYETQKEAAEWLGITSRAICYHKKALKEMT